MSERNGHTGRALALLVVVLLLVLAAFGLLVIALVTGDNGWAWGSVAASAVAGVLLVTDWIARPRATTAAAAEPLVSGDANRPAEGDTPQAPTVERAEASTRRFGEAESGSESSQQPSAKPNLGQPVEPD